MNPQFDQGILLKDRVKIGQEGRLEGFAPQELGKKLIEIFIFRFRCRFRSKNLKIVERIWFCGSNVCGPKVSSSSRVAFKKKRSSCNW